MLTGRQLGLFSIAATSIQLTALGGALGDGLTDAMDIGLAL